MSKFMFAAFVLGCVVASTAQAEIYIYQDQSGGRMVTDHPLPPGDTDYTLVTRRDSLRNAGYIMDKRRPPMGTAADFLAYIRAACSRYKMDPDLVEAVIHVESGFNPHAVSNQGASGLMQLMWKTAQRYQVNDRFDPRENVDAGVHHLSDLMKRFKGKIPFVLAAWNAGAGAVNRYGGVPPFQETQQFVIKVMSYRKELKRLYPSG